MKSNPNQNGRGSKNVFDVQGFQKAASQGKAEDFLNKNLDASTAQRLQQILSNQDEMEKMLNTPAAQELMKKFGDGK